jgi:8-oxo-dGTP pyrophosphatase MutT (NUDIX family)
MKNKVTAAVVIINRDGDILGCHGTGKPKDSGFDFPKGLVEPGETDVQAALRELYEETGIDTVLESDLIDCGIHHHNKEKDIHIFLLKTDEMPDVSTLVCKSTFEICNRVTGEVERECPECNFFEIISKEDRKKFNRVLQDKFEIIDVFNKKSL